jgi:mono/diheme cytochrome c family protein
VAKQSRRVLIAAAIAAVQVAAAPLAFAASAEVLRPRVPPDQIKNVRSVKNPFTATPQIIEKGKALYSGKAFCQVCHGRDGKGLGSDVDTKSMKGALPRDFTDRAWQRARTDGELMWILKHGSQGTAMPAFVPEILTEQEAYQVIVYIRSLDVR